MKSPEKATLEGVIPSHSDSEAVIEGRRIAAASPGPDPKHPRSFRHSASLKDLPR